MRHIKYSNKTIYKSYQKRQYIRNKEKKEEFKHVNGKYLV